MHSQQQSHRHAAPIQTSGTDAFYREKAAAYFDRTFSANMEQLYSAFLPEIGAGRRILDVGCGSGRDVKAFRTKGYAAFGVDPSPELVALASENVGPYFEVGRAETLVTREPFDGVWACASLLHLPRESLHSALRQIRQSLAADGVLLACVQRGNGEQVLDDGRAFTYYSTAEFADAIAEAGFRLIRTWESSDVLRSDGPTWINVLARRT